VNDQSLGSLFKNSPNNLNLIRLLAATAVIYGHANVITGHGPHDIFLTYVGYKFIGGVAVDVFFVISGYLIAQSSVGKNGLLYYAASRLLRIYPALIVCTVIMVFVLGAKFTTDDGYWSNPQVWRYLWTNATGYQIEYMLPGVFENMNIAGVNGSLWSIAVEVRLYILIFVLSLLGVMRNRSFFNFIFFVSLVVVFFKPESFTQFYLLEYENHRHVVMMYLIGSFCYVNRESIPISPVILLVLTVLAASQHRAENFGFFYVLLLPYFVFCVTFSPWGQWFNRFGDYSYGVYLYGWPAQQLVYYFSPESSNLIHTTYATVIALFCAALSWHLMEKPALTLRHKFKKTEGSGFSNKVIAQ
jgi:peptidoglycan/LPS O-acetylase OafA/YrhL